MGIFEELQQRQLIAQITNEEEVKNLIKAFFTPKTGCWIERNFKDTEDEICTKICLIYFYSLKDYEKAYLWAERALQINNTKLTRDNVAICKRIYKELLI